MNLRPTALLAPILLASTAFAQFDTIHLVDGSKLERVRIQNYDFKQLVYKSRSLEESVPRERIFRIELGQVNVTKLFKDARKSQADEDNAIAYQRWLKAAEEADKSKRLKPFAQFAYWEAFQLAKKVGKQQDRLECLDSLQKTQEGKSAFWPEIWRYRLAQARAAAGNDRKKLEAYKALGNKFKAFVAEQDLSERYAIEAELYIVDARSLLRELTGPKLQQALSSLLPRVEGRYPDLANRINLDFAFAVLATGKFEEARKLFSTISVSKVADDLTKARALVGRGHSWFRMPNKSADDSKRALFDYMRVAVLYDDVDQEVVGEALYHAAQAYTQWNGEDAKVNVRRIRSRLKIRYADSSWADK